MRMTDRCLHIAKRLFICLLALWCGCTTRLQAATYSVAGVPNVQLADRTRYTSNPDGILSAGAVTRIDRLCDSLRREGLAQVAVVAVEDIDSDNTFDFAIELFRSWGVGRAQVDNGLGILLVLDRHEIRFVTGGGLEGVLPDALCKRIQTQIMLPRFRENDYDGGMIAGIEAAARLLRSGELDFGAEDDDLPVEAMLIIVGLTLLGFGIVVYAVYRQQTRCPRCGKLALQQEGVRSTKRFVEKTFVCAECGHRVVRRYARHDDNSFGGGGGSFGGGSFSGGGAGSRW